MVRMCFLSCLVMALSLFSQGFLLSFSKSVRKAEGDEMLLDTISLGKAFRSGDAADKSMASPLEHFKNDDTSFLDEDEERIAKNLGQKHTFISHSSLPFDMAKKQFPYLALKGPLVFPSDSEDLTIETAQERRDAGEEENSAKLPIGRRDFDMLRCMLGRVYRPCWQI
ncbi:pro-MCH [Pleurodeles waltl]|uniref:pro-MCH n=1 Tax=Pleurodeles waltl TaxID=8319 RepID=UPI0037099FC5